MVGQPHIKAQFPGATVDWRWHPAIQRSPSEYWPNQATASRTRGCARFCFAANPTVVDRRCERLYARGGVVLGVVLGLGVGCGWGARSRIWRGGVRESRSGSRRRVGRCNSTGVAIRGLVVCGSGQRAPGDDWRS